MSGKSDAAISPFKVVVHIRWMIRRDMPAVLEIEKSAFEKSWSEDDFIRCLRGRNVIGMIAEKDEELVGYMIYEIHKGYLQLLNIAVHMKYLRCGVGTQIVQKLVGKLSKRLRNRLKVWVSDDNLRAHLFFRSQGFKAVKVLRDYFERGADAYVMELCI